MIIRRGNNEVIDVGPASAKGEFHRLNRRQAREIQQIKKQLLSKSDWAAKQYIKGFKGQSTRSKRFFEREMAKLNQEEVNESKSNIA